jgi:protein-tyrosine phosphatase
MVATPYWVDGWLAIVARPRGGDWLDDEMLALRAAQVDVVVSMLERSEAEHLGLAQEKDSAERAGLSFVNFPIPDREVPGNLAEFNNFLEGLKQEMALRRRVGIHCRACIGRASVAAASLLIRNGAVPDEAWRQVEAARGFPVPDTPEQREWVDRNIGRKP